MKREHARRLRALIEQTAVNLTDEEALTGIELFHVWKEDGAYQTGDRVRYSDTLYKCLQDHTAQSTWTPTDAPSLWAEVLIPDPEVIPEWKQPDSTNPYMKGDKVTHLGKTWVSDIDNNVWEPPTMWSEVV